MCELLNMLQEHCIPCDSDRAWSGLMLLMKLMSLTVDAGMGYESARACAASGYATTLACRSVDKAEEAKRRLM